MTRQGSPQEGPLTSPELWAAVEGATRGESEMRSTGRAVRDPGAGLAEGWESGVRGTCRGAMAGSFCLCPVAAVDSG